MSAFSHLVVLLLFGCYGVARVDLEMWVQSVHRLLTCCKEACSWFVQLLASPEGIGYLK